MTNQSTYIVKQYKTTEGKIPFKEWLDKLKDRRAAVAIARRFARQVSAGSIGDIKPIKGSHNIYEFRNHMGPGYRVYCLIHDGKVIILMCGGDKSTQHKDIKKAEEYRDDIFKRGFSDSTF